MVSTEPPGSPERGRTRRRSQVFSLPFSLRSSSKRTSITDNSLEQAKCIERMHYPVFDPEDSRHLPSVHEHGWRRRESQTSSSESQKPANGIHNLPLRSLHKARSGLIALAAGLIRRPARQSADQVDGISPSRPMEEHGQEHPYPPAPLSEASTEEDLSFGYELSRDVDTWSASSDNHRLDDMIAVASVHTLNAVIASAMSSPQARQYHSEPTGLDTLRQSSSQYALSGPSKISVTDSRFADELEGIPETEPLVADNMRSTSDIDLTESALSMLQESLNRSGQSVDKFHGLCNVEGEDTVLGVSGRASVDSEGPRGRSLNRLPFEGGVENELSAQREEEMADRSMGSFTFPDPDALSTLSSNVSGGFSIAQSEAFATQERLQLPGSSGGIEEAVQLGEGSGQYSVEVQIAFPGIHQALVEQWMEDSQRSAQMATDEGAVTVNAASAAERDMSGQTSLAAQLASSHDVTWLSESHAHPETVSALYGQQTASASSPVSMAQGKQPVVEECTMLQTSQDSAVEIGSPESTTESAQATGVSSERRHSFGLHISLRNANDDGGQFDEPNRQSYTPDNHYSTSSLGLGGVPGSLCDESDFSTSQTRGSTTSAEITSPTSMSGSAWSPLDSPIDEEVYFSGFFRNEFYMGDGKTSGQRPDRGDLPVKAARRAMGDGTIYSGFGLDRAPSYRTRGMTEMMLEGTTRQAQPAMRAITGSEESHPAEDLTLERQS